MTRAGIITVLLLGGIGAAMAAAGERTKLESYAGTAEVHLVDDRRVIVGLDIRDSRGNLDGRADQLFLVTCREAARLDGLTGRFETQIEYNGYLGSLRVTRLEDGAAAATARFSIGIKENDDDTPSLGCERAVGISRVGLERKLVNLDEVAQPRAAEDCSAGKGACWEIGGTPYIFPG